MQANYQVIARRWRPKHFSELVGQEAIVRTLQNAIASGRIAHAYLFVGPRGTGKTSTARLFAAALNAPNDDALAQIILQGNCMDVIEIDGASNNSVDQIRSLREDCQYAPTQCRYKIYIIDEVHMLSTAAFNALLKTLEEPPGHVKFIFATTESAKVLPTIVSRCQRFEFRPIQPEVITAKLAEISQSEGIQVERAALEAIARLACGGMRDAQSILDQMIAFCGRSIRENDVLDVYGLISSADLNALAESLYTANYKAALDYAQSYTEAGKDLLRILVDLQTKVREHVLVAFRTGNTPHTMTAESLMRLLESLQASQDHLQTGLSESAHFEVALLKAIDMSRTRSIDSLIQKLTHLEQPPSSESGKKKITTQLAPEPEAMPIHLDGPPIEELNVMQHTNPSTLAHHLPTTTQGILEQRFKVRYTGVTEL